MIDGPATVAGIVPAPTDVAFDRDSGRARLPDRSGFATSSDGVRLAFDVYGDGDTTLVLLPSTPIVHSRQWKGQIHYLSRHYRVVAYDGRGNGRSDRPDRARGVRRRPDGRRRRSRHGCDGHASRPCSWACAATACGGRSASRPRDRSASLGIVAFARRRARGCRRPTRSGVAVLVRRRAADGRGLGEAQPPLLAARLPRVRRFFFSAIALRAALHEGHRGRRRSGRVDGSVDAMLAEGARRSTSTLEEVEAICRAVRCPMLLVHGTEDHCQPVGTGARDSRS